MEDKFNKSEEEIKEELSPEAYEVLRHKGTEAAFSGAYWNEHGEGIYKCAVCGAELFSSETKFDSGTGWPSFSNPVNLEHVELRDDDGYGMKRIEVTCKTCGSHLGHIFDDGPADKGGKRYCINSVCLVMKKKE